MEILVDQSKSPQPGGETTTDDDAKRKRPPLSPINLLGRSHAEQHGPRQMPARTRGSRTHGPAATEVLHEEIAARPTATLLDGAELARRDPARDTERPAPRRRVSNLAFTRGADAIAVLAAPLAAGYVARSAGLFVACAGLIALARSRARAMTLGERAINAITPLGATLAVLAVESADAALTVDTTRTHVLKATLVALLVSVGSAIGSMLFARHFVRMRVAVIGSLTSAHELALELLKDRNAHYVVAGFITPPGDHDSMRDPRHVSFHARPLGELAQLDSIVERNDIDMLVLAQGNDRLEIFERAAACAERRLTRLVGLGTFNENVFQRVSIEELNSAWLQHMMHPRYRPAPTALIRTLDIAGALALGILALPFLLVAATAVRAEDGGPVLYRQRRVGEGGRDFTIVKFRSMRTDAEDGGPRWSSDDDDRVTRVGRVIRRFHVDELPQLINVLRGDMSLVGPRPERPEFVHRLERDIPFYGRRHLIKPGVTGWAQVRAGYGMSDDGQAVKLSRDLFYLKHRSALLYMYVLVATAFTVAAGTVHSRAH
ncbi:MAG: sugar transferase [Thermoleophilia bacterium]|nr:sugar transferase [Thermoleophilia bacterium]